MLSHYLMEYSRCDLTPLAVVGIAFAAVNCQPGRSGLRGCGNGKFWPAATHSDTLVDCRVAAHSGHHSGCYASVANGGAAAGDRA